MLVYGEDFSDRDKLDECDLVNMIFDIISVLLLLVFMLKIATLLVYSFKVICVKLFIPSRLQYTLEASGKIMYNIVDLFLLINLLVSVAMSFIPDFLNVNKYVLLFALFLIDILTYIIATITFKYVKPNQ